MVTWLERKRNYEALVRAAQEQIAWANAERLANQAKPEKDKEG